MNHSGISPVSSEYDESRARAARTWAPRRGGGLRAVGHPRAPQDRPDRLPLADPPLHRPPRRDPLRPRRPGAGRRLPRRRPCRGAACPHRARRRHPRRPRQHPTVGRAAGDGRRVRRARPGRPAAARAGAAGLRRAVRLVPAPRRHHGLSGDARRLLGVQALRASAYGLGSVLIGVALARAGRSGTQVGLVLGALLAGSALASLLLARFGDRVGRRRSYRLLLGAMGAAGTVFALTTWPPALILAALTGTVSTEVVESGPFTSLEQAMLPHTVNGDATRLFGTYNTVATLAGSLGALVAL